MPMVRLSKRLPAAREDVFAMWLNRDSVARWMSPPWVTITNVILEPHVGGQLRIDLQAENQSPFYHGGEFLEITPPERIRFSWQTSGVAHEQSEVTVEFHERGNDCEVVIIHEKIADDRVKRQETGWTAILDSLDEFLTTHS